MKDFNILIVEDELMIAEMSKEMLLELGYNVIGIAKNYAQAKTYLSNSTKIDLVILDINLSQEKDGIDLAKEIEKKHEFPFIYLTSYSDPRTIKNASSTTPSAYLLKPYTKEDLFTTVEIIRARARVKGLNLSIVIKEGHLNIRVKVEDIIYIKSDNNYLEIFTTDKRHILRSSLESFLLDLNNEILVRTHRSYAININKITAVNGQNIFINDTKYPLSRTHREEVLMRFISN